MTMFAPLAPDELYRLEHMLYRAFNRLCDEAERALYETESHAPATLQGKQLLTRSGLFMAAMLDMQELHAIACRAGTARRKGQ